MPSLSKPVLCLFLFGSPTLLVRTSSARPRCCRRACSWSTTTKKAAPSPAWCSSAPDFEWPRRRPVRGAPPRRASASRGGPARPHHAGARRMGAFTSAPQESGDGRGGPHRADRRREPRGSRARDPSRVRRRTHQTGAPDPNRRNGPAVREPDADRRARLTRARGHRQSMGG